MGRRSPRGQPRPPRPTPGTTRPRSPSRTTGRAARTTRSSSSASITSRSSWTTRTASRGAARARPPTRAGSSSTRRARPRSTATRSPRWRPGSRSSASSPAMGSSSSGGARTGSRPSALERRPPPAPPCVGARSLRRGLVMKPPSPGCTAFRALPWLAKANALGLCAAVLAVAALLWRQWLHDDELTHGVFLPFLAAILVAESRRDPEPRFLRRGAGPLAACSLLALLGLASLAVAVVYAAAMGWSHAMAEFMLCGALFLVLCAAWLAFADDRVRFVPLNWPAAVAVSLWLFAGPPPPGTYARLALFLQGGVTAGVVGTLHAAGIAAYRDGNVIELARTSVGVSEACSGVRSLVSCAVAGLFLSAVLVRRPLHRAVVIVLSPVIALAMNFLRSLLLTLLANGGVAIEGRWHDLTGSSIIVGTTLLVAALGFGLRRREAPEARGGPVAGPAPSGRSAPQWAVASGILAAAFAAAVLAAAGSPARGASREEPDLAALLPDAPEGWTAN